MKRGNLSIIERRRGFTLVELMTAGALTSLLLVLISTAWSGFGRPSAIAVARARIMHEANLALESLARDFSGSLVDEPLGTKESGRLVGRQARGDALILCYDGGELNGSPDWRLPDTVIQYRIVENQLLRMNLAMDQQVLVADNVTEMAISETKTGILIELKLSFRDITQTYIVETRDP